MVLKLKMQQLLAWSSLLKASSSLAMSTLLLLTSCSGDACFANAWILKDLFYLLRWQPPHILPAVFLVAIIHSGVRHATGPTIPSEWVALELHSAEKQRKSASFSKSREANRCWESTRMARRYDWRPMPHIGGSWQPQYLDVRLALENLIYCYLFLELSLAKALGRTCFEYETAPSNLMRTLDRMKENNTKNIEVGKIILCYNPFMLFYPSADILLIQIQPLRIIYIHQENQIMQIMKQLTYATININFIQGIAIQDLIIKQFRLLQYLMPTTSNYVLKELTFTKNPTLANHVRLCFWSLFEIAPRQPTLCYLQKRKYVKKGNINTYLSFSHLLFIYEK